MRKYAIFYFLLFFSNYLIADEIFEYSKDEWENDFGVEEKELFNIIESQDEVQKKEEPSNNYVKNNYFTKMYVEGVFNWRKNQSNTYLGKISSHILASYYEAFLSFAPSSKNTLALRFSPVLMHYPKNHTSPVFSLYLGNFNTPQIFSSVYKPLASNISPTSNRKFFPPLNAMKIAKKHGNEGLGLEVSLPFFNFYSFWKNTKKGNIFNFYTSYKTNFSNLSRLNIAILSSIQEIKIENLKKNPHLQIYGLDFNFDHPIFYLNSLSLLTILPKRTPSFKSFAFNTEAGLTSNLASLHTGISYKGAYYLGNQNIQSLLQRKSFLSFYLQGKFKFKIFRLNGMYHLIKDYKMNKLKHSYGIFYSLGNSFFSYKNELLYKTNVYKIKFALNIAPKIIFFKSFNIYSFLYLEDRVVNLYCFKKYEIATKCSFNIAKYFGLNFSFTMMQENKNWEKIAFLTVIVATFNFKQEKTKEKAEIKLKYNSKKNVTEISLKFKIEY